MRLLDAGRVTSQRDASDDDDVVDDDDGARDGGDGASARASFADDGDDHAAVRARGGETRRRGTGTIRSLNTWSVVILFCGRAGVDAERG